MWPNQESWAKYQENESVNTFAKSNSWFGLSPFFGFFMNIWTTSLFVQTSGDELVFVFLKKMKKFPEQRTLLKWSSDWENRSATSGWRSLWEHGRYQQKKKNTQSLEMPGDLQLSVNLQETPTFESVNSQLRPIQSPLLLVQVQEANRRPRTAPSDLVTNGTVWIPNAEQHTHEAMLLWMTRETHVSSDGFA